MSTRNRKLHMEQMEGRRLMAVTGAFAATTTGTLTIDPGPSSDIAAYVQNGNLYVNEATGFLNSDNGVRIAQLADGHIRVMGASANNGSNVDSTVNGAAFQDFTITGSLFVNLGGGNDRLQIGFDDGSGAPSFNEMHIDMAAPKPVLTSAKPTAGATTGSILNIPDDDHVFFWVGNTQGGVTINTGIGSDWVFVRSANIGDGISADDLIVNTGAGGDQVDIKGAQIHGNLDIQTYSNVAENDTDLVNFDWNYGPVSIVDGSVNIRMGAGADAIYSTDPNYADPNIFWLGLQTHGSFTADTGAGNDLAFLRNLRVDGNFSLNMGAGADTLEMRQTPIDGEFGIPSAGHGNMTVQMYSSTSETDADSATFNKVGSDGSLSVLMGGGADTLKLTDFTAFHDMTLDLGAGNDNAELTRVMGHDNFFANLGDGDDILKITDLFGGLGLTRVLGSNGYDQLTKTGAFPVSKVEQTGWEVINGRRQDLLNIAVKPKTLARK